MTILVVHRILIKFICESYKDEEGKSVLHIISVLHILNLADKRASTLLSFRSNNKNNNNKGKKTP